MSKLNFKYEEWRDTMVIEGMSYSGDLFRAFAKGGLELHIPFVFIKRDDGVVVIRCLKTAAGDACRACEHPLKNHFCENPGCILFVY